jgi:hypothetical protein
MMTSGGLLLASRTAQEKKTGGGCSLLPVNELSKHTHHSQNCTYNFFPSFILFFILMSPCPTVDCWSPYAFYLFFFF